MMVSVLKSQFNTLYNEVFYKLAHYMRIDLEEIGVTTNTAQHSAKEKTIYLGELQGLMTIKPLITYEDGRR